MVKYKKNINNNSYIFFIEYHAEVNIDQSCMNHVFYEIDSQWKILNMEEKNNWNI